MALFCGGEGLISCDGYMGKTVLCVLDLLPCRIQSMTFRKWLENICSTVCAHGLFSSSTVGTITVAHLLFSSLSKLAKGNEFSMMMLMVLIHLLVAFFK